MTKEEAVEVFNNYLKTGIVPSPYKLQEASKIAIDCIKATKLHESYFEI